MDWGLVSVALMWLMVGMTALSAVTSIVVLGRKGWRKGLGAVALAMLLVGLLAAVQMLSPPAARWSGLLVSCLFSAVLSCLVMALRQFRQLDTDWRWLFLAPAAVLLLGSLTLGEELAPVLLYAMHAVFAIQLGWLALELWRMRALRLGTGYRMLCVALGVFLAGMLYLQCGPGQGLPQEAAPMEQPLLWYWARTALNVVVMLQLTLGFMRMVQDRREARSRRAALRDPLTRMLNRRALVRALEHCIKDAGRQAHPLALLLIDVDHFKRVNDTHGHISGDKVLRHVSRVLASNVRSDVYLGRFGGEEFVIVCPGTGMEEAQILAERLILAVRSSSVLIKGHALQVTVSIGGFAGAVGAHTPWETLLEAADSAMYRAKASGRNCVVMHRQLPAPPAESSAPHWRESRA